MSVESPLLELNNVVKNYDSYCAVNQVSFDIPRGCLFGLLGPNGAGKTSLIRIITTITRADSGTVLFDGHPINTQSAAWIGYMPEERGMYKKMKVGEQVTYLARLKGMSAAEADKQIAYWFKKFDITSWWYKKVEELSKGMQQKVQFISTVIHQPKLLILDEPFSGLDPINANLIKDEIYELHKKGTTIIFSTHRMEQVEEICDHIVLINKGKNILTGHINDIRNQFKENLFKVSYEGHIPDEALNGLNIHEQTAQHLKIQLHPQNTTNSILAHLIDKGIHITAFHEELPSLNNIFINLVEQSNQHA